MSGWGGGQGICEQRSEVLVKIQEKFIYFILFFFLVGGGGQGGREGLKFL